MQCVNLHHGNKDYKYCFCDFQNKSSSFFKAQQVDFVANGALRYLNRAKTMLDEVPYSRDNEIAGLDSYLVLFPSLHPVLVLPLINTLPCLKHNVFVENNSSIC